MMSSLALNQSFAPQPTTGTVCLIFFKVASRLHIIVAILKRLLTTPPTPPFLRYNTCPSRPINVNALSLVLKIEDCGDHGRRTKDIQGGRKSWGHKKNGVIFADFAFYSRRTKTDFNYLFFREEGGRMAGRAGQAVSRTSAGLRHHHQHYHRHLSVCYISHLIAFYVWHLWSSSLLTSSGLGAPHLLGDSQEPSLELSSLESNAIR